MTKMDNATHFVSRRSLLKAGGVPIETTSAPPALSSERRETKCVALSCLVIVASLNPSSPPRA